MMNLMTPLGSRPHNRSFGSKLHTLPFDMNDSVLQDLASIYITEALENEPRVSFGSMSYERIDTTAVFKVVLFRTDTSEQMDLEFGFNV